jgi:hypothetical protein
VEGRWVRARRLLLRYLVKVGWRVVGRPFRGRWKCLVLRLWVARAVVVLLVATEVGFVVVVVIVAPTAAVIALGLALAAALEQTLQSEQLLAERAGLVCFGVRLVPGVLLLLAALRSAVCRWWSARVRHLARPCCLRYFTCILHWYNGT